MGEADRWNVDVAGLPSGQADQAEERLQGIRFLERLEPLLGGIRSAALPRVKPRLQ